MKRFLHNKWLIFALRLILGVIFIVASISKIQDIDKFISTVSGYRMLPDSMAHLYAIIVPWVELFAGCALIPGVLISFSAALLIALIVSFIAASSYALLYAVNGPCGCFGKFLTLSHPAALTIDIIMLIAAIILLFNQGKEFLSIGQIVDRFRIKSTIISTGSRFALVGILMGVLAFGSIGIHNLVKQTEPEIETVNLPAPLVADVDAALSQHKPVLMEFYADGCSLCLAAAPIIYDMEKEFVNRVVVQRIDYRLYYQNAQFVSDLRINNIPSVLVITGKNSEGQYTVTGRFEGTIPREKLQASLEQAVRN